MILFFFQFSFAISHYKVLFVKLIKLAFSQDSQELSYGSIDPNPKMTIALKITILILILKGLMHSNLNFQSICQIF